MYQLTSFVEFALFSTTLNFCNIETANNSLLTLNCSKVTLSSYKKKKKLKNTKFSLQVTVKTTYCYKFNLAVLSLLIYSFIIF